MTLQLLRALGVGGVDTRIEQATPRARKRDENGDVPIGPDTSPIQIEVGRVSQVVTEMPARPNL